MPTGRRSTIASLPMMSTSKSALRGNTLVLIVASLFLAAAAVRFVSSGDLVTLAFAVAFVFIFVAGLVQRKRLRARDQEEGT